MQDPIAKRPMTVEEAIALGRSQPQEQTPPRFGGLMENEQGLEQATRAAGPSLVEGIETAIPQVAGFANMHPALRSTGMTFAVPTVVESLRQVLSGEEFDPSRAAFHGGMGVVGKGVGELAGKVTQFGRRQIGNVLAPDDFPVASEKMIDLATKHRPKLSREGVEALQQKYEQALRRSVERERGVTDVFMKDPSRAGRGATMTDADEKALAKLLRGDKELGRLGKNAEEIKLLMDRVGRTPTSGGGTLPIFGAILHQGGPSTLRASGGGSSMLGPASTLAMGERLGNPNVPPTAEGIVRALMALVSSGMGPGEPRR